MYKEVLLVFVLCFVTRYGLAANVTYDAASKVEPTFYGPYLKDGEEAVMTRFPYTVRLLRTSKPWYKENGVIISEKFVLTSAWSIYFLNVPSQCAPSNLAVIKLGDQFDAHDTYCHKKYDEKNRLNNIGLIKIKGIFTFSAYIKPIKISWQFPILDIPIIISSFGEKNKTTLKFSESYSIDKWVFSQLTTKDRQKFFLHPSIGCIHRSDGPLASFGDGGAPVTHDGELIGVVSRFFPDSPLHTFTKVAHHRKWIEGIVGKLPSKGYRKQCARKTSIHRP